LTLAVEVLYIFIVISKFFEVLIEIEEYVFNG